MIQSYCRKIVVDKEENICF